MTRGDHLRIDAAQPLNYGNSVADSLLRGVQGFWLPLPHLTGSSRLYDLSGRQFNMSLTGGLGDASWLYDVDSSFPAVDVRGADTRTSDPNGKFGGTDKATWVVYADFSDGGGKNYFFSKYNTSGERSWALRDKDGSGLVVNLGKNQGDNFAGNNLGGALTSKHVVVVTYDGGRFDEINGYIDGTFVGGANYNQPSLVPSAADVVFGDRGNVGGGPWDGSIYFGAMMKGVAQDSSVRAWTSQVHRGFPDLLNTRGGF